MLAFSFSFLNSPGKLDDIQKVTPQRNYKLEKYHNYTNYSNMPQLATNMPFVQFTSCIALLLIG